LPSFNLAVSASDCLTASANTETCRLFAVSTVGQGCEFHAFHNLTVSAGRACGPARSSRTTSRVSAGAPATMSAHNWGASLTAARRRFCRKGHAWIRCPLPLQP
jgi:hypothetical protein